MARHGRKRYAYYHIVVADSRAPRDGRFIERIGMYNPNTNPATIELDFDKALSWLQKGAQPTDTARAILSYKGVMMKRHLLDGVKKGAFDEATAEAKFQAWLRDKESKIQAKKDRLEKSDKDDLDQRFEAEKKVKEERAEAIAKKIAKLAAAEAAAEAGDDVAEADVAETPEASAHEETPAVEMTEEPVAEMTEEPVAEVTEEPVAEMTEEPVAEIQEETPSEEAQEEVKEDVSEETKEEEPGEPEGEAEEKPAE